MIDVEHFIPAHICAENISLKMYAASWAEIDGDTQAFLVNQAHNDLKKLAGYMGYEIVPHNKQEKDAA